jgi:hypothetical protein
MDTSKAMDELRKIKEELSLLYLSQTPEERRRDSEEAIKIAEARLGRPIKTVDYSRSGQAAKEEAVHV